MPDSFPRLCRHCKERYVLVANLCHGFRTELWSVFAFSAGKPSAARANWPWLAKEHWSCHFNGSRTLLYDLKGLNLCHVQMLCMYH